MVKVLLNEEHTEMQIAAKSGVPKSCVGRLKKRLQETGLTSIVKKSSRPSKISKRITNYLKPQLTRIPFQTSNQSSDDLALANVIAKLQTIRHWCQKVLNLPSRRPAKNL